MRCRRRLGVPGWFQGLSPEGASASFSLLVLGHGFQPWLGHPPLPSEGASASLLRMGFSRSVGGEPMHLLSQLSRPGVWRGPAWLLRCAAQLTAPASHMPTQTARWHGTPDLPINRLTDQPINLPRCHGNTFARANGTPPSLRNRGKMKFSAAGPARTYGKGGHYGNTFARANRAVGLRVEARLRCAPPGAIENRIGECEVRSAECGGHRRNPFPLFVRVACPA